MNNISKTANDVVNKYSSLLDRTINFSVDDPLRIIFIGEFNSGKSTLINALLKENLLPSDIFQTTATINRVQYGLLPQINVMSVSGEVITQFNNTQDLIKYNADHGSFQNIGWLEITTPSIPHGIEIIDTPGFNDPDPIRDKKFLSIIPEADIIVLVSDAVQPLKGSEIPYIKKFFLNNFNRMIFVMNQCDLVDKKNLSSVVLDVTKQLEILRTDISSTMSEHGLEAASKKINNIQISNTLFCLSAQNEISSIQPKSPEMAELLQNEFIRFRQYIFGLIEKKESLRSVAQLSRFLSFLRAEEEQIESQIKAIESGKNHSQIMVKDILFHLKAIENHFTELTIARTTIPEKLKQQLNYRAQSTVERLTKFVKSIQNSPYGRQAFEKEIQAIAATMLHETELIISRELTLALRLEKSDKSINVDIDHISFTPANDKLNELMMAQTGGHVAGQAVALGLQTLDLVIPGLGTFASILAQATNVAIVGGTYSRQKYEDLINSNSLNIQISNSLDAFIDEVIQETTHLLDNTLSSAKHELNSTQHKILNFLEINLQDTSKLQATLKQKIEKIRHGIHQTNMLLTTIY